MRCAPAPTERLGDQCNHWQNDPANGRRPTLERKKASPCRHDQKWTQGTLSMGVGTAEMARARPICSAVESFVVGPSLFRGQEGRSALSS
jgi:hypothetical protein